MFSEESTQNLSTRLLSLTVDTHMSSKVVTYRCVNENVFICCQKIVFVKNQASSDLLSVASINCYKAQMKTESSLKIHMERSLKVGG